MWVLVFAKECFPPLIFLIYMNWKDKLRQPMSVSGPKHAKLVSCFLLASLETGLQHALNGFAAACDIAGMKFSTSKTQVLHL